MEEKERKGERRCSSVEPTTRVHQIHGTGWDWTKKGQPPNAGIRSQRRGVYIFVHIDCYPQTVSKLPIRIEHDTVQPA